LFETHFTLPEEKYMRHNAFRFGLLLVVAAIALSACAPASTPAPAATAAPTAAGFQIPDIQAGKFNVAVVLIGFHADGGWSQAHTEGAQWMSTQDATIAVQYVELVNPGPDAETVMRSLARKGFDLIIGTTFEYGPTMDALAEEFPKTSWLHVSGYRSNGKNYGNLFGAMEDMKYIAGMVAGARAKADGNTKLGYVAPWPLPEVIRLGNAFMLGAKQTCAECTMEVRWINTWYDPDKEKQAAQSLRCRFGHRRLLRFHGRPDASAGCAGRRGCRRQGQDRRYAGRQIYARRPFQGSHQG
jgi:basic membrane protein A